MVEKGTYKARRELKKELKDYLLKQGFTVQKEDSTNLALAKGEGRVILEFERWDAGYNLFVEVSSNNKKEKLLVYTLMSVWPDPDVRGQRTYKLGQMIPLGFTWENQLQFIRDYETQIFNMDPAILALYKKDEELFRERINKPKKKETPSR